MRDVWVVVPVYNEESCVGNVVRELRREFEHVLCVDDGSTDRSAAEGAEAGALVLSHAINLGQGAALQTAFDYLATRTEAKTCVTFDADGQHRVEDAVRLVDALEREQRDVALASRFQGTTSGMPFTRALVLRAGLWFTRASTGLALTDTHNGLRALTRAAFSQIRLEQNRMAYASELLAAIPRLGLSWVEVEAHVEYTAYSLSKGQANVNAINILFDLTLARLRAIA